MGFKSLGFAESLVDYWRVGWHRGLQGLRNDLIANKFLIFYSTGCLKLTSKLMLACLRHLNYMQMLQPVGSV